VKNLQENMNVCLFKEQYAMFHIIIDKTWDPTFVTKFHSIAGNHPERFLRSHQRRSPYLRTFKFKNQQKKKLAFSRTFEVETTPPLLNSWF